MKNAESKRKLLEAIQDFSGAYNNLVNQIDSYERETGLSVNDLPGFTDGYPFDKSFDELQIREWYTNIIEKSRAKNYTILNYQYLNTGGHCMVGISEVWLSEELKTVYVFVNEEGATMSLVDYIRHDIQLDDYDEVIIDYVDWGRVVGSEKYFELYRDCFNAYLKDDCNHFGYVKGVSYDLLSDDLQSQVSDEYLEYANTECGGLIDTDGRKIIMVPGYEFNARMVGWLQEIKDFSDWHSNMAAREELYEECYTIIFNGKSVQLPYDADTYSAIDDLLRDTIEQW